MPRLRLAPICLFASIVCTGFVIAAVNCDDSGGIGTPDNGNGFTGCKVSGATPPTAPNGYYVNGNTICTLSGEPHLLHGVDRPSMEWSSIGEHMGQSDFMSMATWHANVVRIALNQDFWLSDSPAHDANYPPLVQRAVQWAHNAGLDVILDLHWSDKGDYTVKPGQQTMADLHSVTFWQEVATMFKNDGRVIFELYNEPHDIAPDVWLNGGTTSFKVVGMQQLHDTVRGVGANNLVIAGGLNYAYDLSVVQSGLIAGYNIIYATHPYSQDDPAGWFTSFGFLTSTQPVIATEFGDGTGTCSSTYASRLISYADAHSMSWTAWAWYPGGCTFPALLSNWSYGTTDTGAAVKTALLSYKNPTPPSPDAGSDAKGTGGGGGASTGVGAGGAGGAGGSGAGGNAETAASSGGAVSSGGAGPTTSSVSSGGAGGTGPSASSAASGGAGGAHAAGGAGGTGG